MKKDRIKEGLEKMETLNILSEHPIKQIWTVLSRWESQKAARKLLLERAKSQNFSIKPDVLTKKEIGLAYFLRNSREYLEEASENWTKRILSSYYGMFSLISAIMIADPESKFDLDSLEQISKYGHGLANLSDDSANFPESEYVYLKSSGFFKSYLDYMGYDVNDLCINGRPNKKEDVGVSDKSKLLSFNTLLSRIPEISQFFYGQTGNYPLNVGIFHSSKNQPHCKDQQNRVWVGLNFITNDVDKDFILKKLQPPLKEIECCKNTNGDYWHGYLLSEVHHEWWDKIKSHKSAMSGTSWIKPILEEVDDYLSINFIILYYLSIIVRYRPKLWREICEGEHDEYLSIIRFYLEVVNRVVPEIALEKISGKRVMVAQPGSFNAPV